MTMSRMFSVCVPVGDIYPWLIPNLAWSDDFLSTFTMQLSPGGVVGNL